MYAIIVKVEWASLSRTEKATQILPERIRKWNMLTHWLGTWKTCLIPFLLLQLFKDVIKVVKLLNILADRIDKDESYIPSLCSLLGLFKYPFLKEKASDELVYEQVIIECLANIGRNFIHITQHVCLYIIICD